MATAQSYESAMISRLRMTDPQMSTMLGTPIRKVLEAVAYEMAGFDADQLATTILYDIDSVSGNELDYLVGMFGFTRQDSKAARGTLTFSRDNGDSVLSIPYGSQFYKPATSTSGAIYFQTTSYQQLNEGVLKAEIPVVAVAAGTSGNVAADTVTRGASVSGYASVTNVEAMTGGRDAETDADLRARFTATVFRNLSSTADQYLALARANANVSRAVLVGQSSRYRETVQGTQGVSGTAVSVNEEHFQLDVAKVLDTRSRWWLTVADTGEQLGVGEYVVSQDGKSATISRSQASEIVGPIKVSSSYSLSRRNVTFVSATDADGDAISQGSSTFTLDGGNGVVYVPATSTLEQGRNIQLTYSYDPVEAGQFVTIEFDYLSRHNRGTSKSVDLYVDGQEGEYVTDIEFLDLTKLVTAQNASQWVRDDGTTPEVGHPVVYLAFQPALSSIYSANAGVSTILMEGRHFLQLHDVTSTAQSVRGIDAIELMGTVSSGRLTFEADLSLSMTDGTPMSIQYYRNATVDEVQRLVDSQSVVTSDALVHAVKRRRVRVYVTVMLKTFPRDQVTQGVHDAVVKWANSLELGAPVQFSDIEVTCAGVAGVDSARVATQSDSGGAYAYGSSPVDEAQPYGAYGVVEYQIDGETQKAQHADDFLLAANEALEVEDVIVYTRSQKGW